MNDVRSPFSVVGIVPNPTKPEAVALGCELADFCASRGVRVLMFDEAAAKCGRESEAAPPEKLARTDLLLVLGGDGTILHWTNIAGPHGTPMLGVNFGRYGFITEVTRECATEAVASVLEGKYFISERVVLEAELVRGGAVVSRRHALNEVVVSKGPLTRMLSLRTYVNDRYLVSYRADGIIVSSPTGSTAYSLSAGGPVVHPDVNVLIITPICPHTLNERSLVVPDGEVVKIVGEAQEGAHFDAILATDGHTGKQLRTEDVVIVHKAPYKAKLVQIEPDTFYHKIRTRLRWGERFDEPREKSQETGSMGT